MLDSTVDLINAGKLSQAKEQLYNVLASAAQANQTDVVLPAKLLLANIELDLKNFPEARQNLLDVLAIDGSNLEANHLLGALCVSDENYTDAIQYYLKVENASVNNLDAMLSLGVCYEKLGDLAQANCHRLNAFMNGFVEPKFIVELSNWLFKYGNNDEKKTFIDYLYVFLESAPNDYEFDRLTDVANRLFFEDEVQEAARLYQFLSNRVEYDSEFCANFAEVLRLDNRLAEAQQWVKAALEIDPYSETALATQGNLYASLGDSAAAASIYLNLVEKNPNSYSYHYNLGNSFQRLFQYKEAIKHFSLAIELNPEFMPAHNNMANSYSGLGLYSKAIEHFQTVLNADKFDAEALANFGGVYMNGGHISESIELLSEALKYDRFNPTAQHNFLYSLCYSTQFIEKDIFEYHKNIGKLIAQKMAPLKQELTAQARGSNGKLKVGFVSGDLRLHSVAFFLEPLLKKINRDKFELYAFPNNTIRDAVSQRLSKLVDHWIDIAGLNDEQALKAIREQGLDIAIDLSGHTSGNRLALFAAGIAPIHVNWLGYPNTTGVASIHYRLSDQYADPVGDSDHFCSEELIRFENSFLCYQGDESIVANQCLPSEENGWITFGSFNNIAKYNDEVLRLWAALLKKHKKSRLVLKSRLFRDPGVCDRYYEFFAKQNVHDYQLLLLDYAADFQSHMALYDSVDIGLDPFPYNGTTTTCEALWMGVPVVTLMQNSHRSRVGSSILNQLGLKELVAPDEHRFLQIVDNLVNDVGRLKSYRLRLREMMQSSALCNAPNFAKEFETILLNLIVKK